MCAQLRKTMENNQNKASKAVSSPNFAILEKACKLITKYALKELTIQPDGTITIVKEMHAQPVVKPPRVRKSKNATPPIGPIVGIPNADLALVAANWNNKADRGQLNNFNRYQTRTVLPNQGEE